MSFPGDLGELSVDFLLVEAGAGAQENVVVASFVVQEARSDDDGRAVATGVVHLAGGLGDPGDDMNVHEGRLTTDLIVAIRHGDDDAFVEAHDKLHGLIEECVEVDRPRRNRGW